MAHAKLHYAVPQKHWVSGTPAGLQHIERVGPVCNHVGTSHGNLTNDPDAVTCTRCQAYLARIEGWNKDWVLAKLGTETIERLMLDVLCDRLDGPYGMRYGLASLIREHAPVRAALRDILRDDMHRYWLSEQAMQAEEAATHEEVSS